MCNTCLDDAWAAGFLDGEGTITLNRFKNRGKWESYALVVKVSQTDFRPLIKLKEIYGGQVTARKLVPNRKPAYQWRISTKEAENFLKRVEPYLVVKKEEARLALEYRALYIGAKGRRTLNKQEIVDIADKLSLLKKRVWGRP